MRLDIVAPLLALPLSVLASPSSSIVFTAKPGKNGAVASESIECSKIGKSILARGGNAIDSLISTTFCVGVVGMYHSGIGGGGFVLVRDESGNFEVVDFRETAPRAATEDMFKEEPMKSVFGGLSVAVPGEIKGLQYLHEKYGSLPWKTLVMPAANLAREGFRVSEDLVRYMNITLSISPTQFLIDDPNWAMDFAPEGRLLSEGEIMTRARYGATLERIAREGPDSFYTGPIAESLVKTVRDDHGILTMRDMASYDVITRTPLQMGYRNKTLTTVGAPASGAILLSNLGIMDNFEDAAEVWEKKPELSVHRFDEAMRFAYGARMSFGDPDFVEGVNALQDHIINPNITNIMRWKINDTSTLPVSAYNPRNISTTPGQGTSHIVTADANGMATSMTTTINLLFGAQLLDPITGIILNDEMNDFSIPGVSNEFGFAPSPANFIRPGKRPLSSVTPVMVSEPGAGLLLTIGAAGGSRIISATTQVIWHVMEHGMPLEEAMKRPRQHDQLLPNEIWLEEGFDEEITRDLQRKGHDTVGMRAGLSAVHGILVREDGSFEAVGEPRQKNSGGLVV